MSYFKESQKNGIEMAAILWRAACKHGDDEMYDKAKELMESIIMAEEIDELVKQKVLVVEMAKSLSKEIEQFVNVMELTWRYNNS